MFTALMESGWTLMRPISKTWEVKCLWCHNYFEWKTPKNKPWAKPPSYCSSKHKERNQRSHRRHDLKDCPTPGKISFATYPEADAAVLAVRQETKRFVSVYTCICGEWHLRPINAKVIEWEYPKDSE